MPGKREKRGKTRGFQGKNFGGREFFSAVFNIYMFCKIMFCKEIILVVLIDGKGTIRPMFPFVAEIIKDLSAINACKLPQSNVLYKDELNL